jgi:PmbA protein
MNYTEFKEAVIANAKAKGLTEYELYYASDEGYQVGVLFHEVNSLSTSGTAGACFRCIHEGHMGYASTELFTEEEAERIVEAAITNGAFIESEGEAFIHPAGDTYQSVTVSAEEMPEVSEMTKLALAAQEEAYATDSHVADGTRTIAGYNKEEIGLCNSKGLDLSYSWQYAVMGNSVTASEGEEKYTSFGFKAAPYHSLDTSKIVKKAVGDAVSRIGEDTIPTGTYTIAFSNEITATFLRTFFSAFSGEDARRGLSLIAGKEGTAIASPLVSICDDPFHKDCLVQLPFDSEGVATYNKKVVENGVLKTLLHNLSTASKAGISSTGNGIKGSYASSVTVRPYNFYMEAGTAGTKEDIFEKVQNGIYVTEFNGLHAGANPVSGDFSLSSAGYLIENGKMGRPIKNFTVSGNYYQWLKDISMVGSDLEFGMPGGTSCFGGPTVVVENMSVAGK